MFILLTTLLSVIAGFGTYTNDMGMSTISDDIVGVMRGLAYEMAPNSFLSSGWALRDGILVGCSAAGLPGMAEGQAKLMLNQYIALTHAQMFDWAYDFKPISCVIYDSAHSKVFVIADSVGAVPMWYHISEGSGNLQSGITFTSDLLGAFSMGLTKVSPVSPGMIMGFDTTYAGNIFFAQHWSTLHTTTRRPDRFSFLPLSFAYQLLARVFDKAATAINNSIMEFDVTDPTSRLVSCAARALSLRHGEYITRPLVLEQNVDSMPLISLILKHIPYYDPSKRKYLEYLGENSATIRRLLIERYEIISSALRYSALSAKPATLVSFFMGNDPPPLAPFKAFLQNYIAAVRGVTVLYPFGEVRLHELVTPGIVNSAVHQALDALHSTNLVCPPEIEMLADNGDVLSLTFQEANVLLFDAQGIPESNIGWSTARHVQAQLSTIASLWQTASEHAVLQSKDVVVVLATSGYAEMLGNFLCSVRSVRQWSDLAASGVLVITPSFDNGIIALSKQLHVGVFSDSLSMELDNCFQEDVNISTFSHEFGTLCYQKLILMRTTTVMYLLLLGFSPLIADIDVVWKADALLKLHELVNFSDYHDRSGEKGFDVAVTIDGAEICGCFVYLVPSPRAIMFWAKLTDRHQRQVMKALREGLQNFFDSEQKILTEIILNDDCDRRSFRAAILPSDMFPSGQLYFNEWTQDQRSAHNVVVIHNNFVVGDDIKKMRFKANGLWTGADGACGRMDDSIRDHWTGLFGKAIFDPVIPSFVQYMPIHNTVYRFTPSTVIQAGMEGFPVLERRGAIITSSDPPTMYGFNSFMMYEISIASANRVSSVGVLLLNSEDEEKFPDDALRFRTTSKHLYERGIFADFTVNRSFFSIDRGGHHHLEADANALHFHSDRVSIESKVTGIAADSTSDTSSSPCVQIVIKILTYNRPKSLLRLLGSLEAAEYMEHKGLVDLEILVDGPRFDAASISGEQERKLIDQVIGIANDFIWPFGRKRVTARRYNIGLLGQWFRSWSPAGPNQASFIFEDDVEVSSQFYRYAYAAVEKYYCEDRGPDFVVPSFQLNAHKDLLLAVRAEATTAHLNLNASPSINDAIQKHLSEKRRNQWLSENVSNISIENISAHARKYAGLPTMYGICLQNQHLNPMRYGSRLEIRNNYNNFLYSLVGSWGPLFLPLPWQAFLEWWAHRCPEILELSVDYAENSSGEYESEHLRYVQQQSLRKTIFEKYSWSHRVEGLVVNHYWRDNNGIWTPWIVRFAFETGIKCMYPHFKNENYVLVTNHREAGENYGSRIGSSERLINSVSVLLNNMYTSDMDVHMDGLKAVKYYDIYLKRSVTLTLNGISVDKDIESFLRYCNAVHDTHYFKINIGEKHHTGDVCALYCSSVLASVSLNANLSKQLDERLSETSTDIKLQSACVRSLLLPISELARWQYDFNLRRAGALYSPDTINEFPRDYENTPIVASSEVCTVEGTGWNDDFSKIHWGYILHMIEARLDRSAPVIHFGCSYLEYAPLNFVDGPRFLTRSTLVNFSGVDFDPEYCMQTWRRGVEPTGQSSCPTVLPDAIKSPFLNYLWVDSSELAILTLRDQEYESLQTKLLPFMTSLRYVLVLTSSSTATCISAPSRLSVKRVLSATIADPFVYFRLVESLCSISTDRGGLMFERVSRELFDRNVSTRSSVSRHQGKLINKRIFF